MNPHTHTTQNSHTSGTTTTGMLMATSTSTTDNHHINRPDVLVYGECSATGERMYSVGTGGRNRSSVSWISQNRTGTSNEHDQQGKAVTHLVSTADG
ncbi:hypothetical protein PXH66_06870 [Synoicihabitans lomoniglobus]|uniref:Uncharacterized protein n=1 Tax=Synoicihabitans lomoniglobus TaxID=2909285 RepID=A0AAF0I4M3_9BACT|nr:hypothetical protein PXH66_06870 [Opitutaceae bacterium LMO-M01]